MMVDSLDMSDADRKVLPPGVYVAMNGRALPWDKVRKNWKTGMFEELEP